MPTANMNAKTPMPDNNEIDLRYAAISRDPIAIHGVGGTEKIASQDSRPSSGAINTATFNVLIGN